jgi:predicted Rossmann fold flavoprotein
MAKQYDVAVIGAGAAGMMCAAVAAARGKRVVLIDHAEKLAEKIRISGGGRCNFTNINTGPANFLSQNPHFCKSALSRYTPQDFLALIKKHRIGHHEKHRGQLFCNDSSEQIIAMLKAECADGDVTWRMPCKIEAVEQFDETFLTRATSKRPAS